MDLKCYNIRWYLDLKILVNTIYYAPKKKKLALFSSIFVNLFVCPIAQDHTLQPRTFKL